jgi:hypothetical protein
MEVAAKLAAMAVKGNVVVSVVVGGRLGNRGIIHNPVQMHLLPHRIVWPPSIMVHPILVKMTLHPALHSVTPQTSECNVKPGMMWARHAMAGSLGKSNTHMCVDRPWCCWAGMR